MLLKVFKDFKIYNSLMNNFMNNLIKIDDLMTIFDNSHPYEQYETILNEPLNADVKSTQNSENDYPHYQECYFITNDNIKKSKKKKNS